MTGGIGFGTSRFWADKLLDKYFKRGQLSGGVKQGGVLERHAQLRCKPSCCKKAKFKKQGIDRVRVPDFRTRPEGHS